MSNLINDLDLPIAHRQGKRQCTQNPLTNFVPFKNWSFSYQAFVSKLDLIQIPRTIQETFRDDNWKNPCWKK